MGIADTLNANSAPTKTQVTNAFNELKKFGWKVFTANSHRPMPKGMVDFPDYHIIGHGKIIYIELKLGQDKLSEGQLELQKMLVDEMVIHDFKTVYYFLADETDYELIRDKILRSKDLGCYAGIHYREKLRVKNQTEKTR